MRGDRSFQELAPMQLLQPDTRARRPTSPPFRPPSSCTMHCKPLSMPFRFPLPTSCLKMPGLAPAPQPVRVASYPRQYLLNHHAPDFTIVPSFTSQYAYPSPSCKGSQLQQILRFQIMKCLRNLACSEASGGNQVDRINRICNLPVPAIAEPKALQAYIIGTT